MINQGGYSDNLRPVDSLESVLTNVMDFAQDNYRKKAGKESLNTSELNALKELKQTAKAVDSLLVNEDFVELLTYIHRSISVCERYVYHPAITQEAKTVWFNQLTTLKGFLGIIDFFRNNNENAFQIGIDMKVEMLNDGLSEGAE